MGDTATEEEVIVETTPIVESAEESENKEKESKASEPKTKTSAVSTKRGIVKNEKKLFWSCKRT